MAITNYTDLQAAISDYLVGFTVNVSTLISLAEAKFNQTLRVNDMIQRVSMDVSGAYWPLPSDYLASKDVRITQNGRMVHADSISTKGADDITANYIGGSPSSISIIGNEIQISPAPTGVVTVELDYYQSIPALSNSNATNWMLTRNPNAYLYGALLHSAPYLREDDRLQAWGTLYQDIISDILLADQRASYGGSPLKARARAFGGY